MITKKRINFNLAILAFIKYSMQANDTVYITEIANFLKLLQEKGITIYKKETDYNTVEELLKKYEEILDYDINTEQILLKNPSKKENLIELKTIIMKNEQFDIFSEIGKVLNKMKTENDSIQLKKLSSLLKEYSDEDLDFIAVYIYLYKNYNDKNWDNYDIIKSKEKLVLRKRYVTASGIDTYDKHLYELIPNLRNDFSINKPESVNLVGLEKKKMMRSKECFDEK